MDKEVINALILQNKSQRTISNELGVSHTTIRYWLSRYGLVTKTSSNRKSETKQCPSCEVIKPKSEYYSKCKTSHSYYCKDCVNKKSSNRTKHIKHELVDMLGGKCIMCGYSKCVDALEFHHRDPTQKDFDIDQLRKRNLQDEELLLEVDKCDLLCSNCHRLCHENMTLQLRTTKLSQGTTSQKGGSKFCTRCKKFHPLNEFFARAKGDDGLSKECKSCNYQRKTDNTRIIKQHFVEYKGGGCSICSYNKCLSALEFHHVDPEKKEFRLSRIQGKKDLHLYYNELDKCILACSNCHREIHHEWNSHTS